MWRSNKGTQYRHHQGRQSGNEEVAFWLSHIKRHLPNIMLSFEDIVKLQIAPKRFYPRGRDEDYPEKMKKIGKCMTNCTLMVKAWITRS